MGVMTTLLHVWHFEKWPYKYYTRNIVDDTCACSDRDNAQTILLALVPGLAQLSVTCCTCGECLGMSPVPPCITKNPQNIHHKLLGNTPASDKPSSRD